MIIFDFDGTLFNTLPVHFRIKKQNAYKELDVFLLHQEFVQKRQKILELYTEVWRDLIQKLFKQHKVFLISETSKKILCYYLKTFSLISFFSQIYGNQNFKDGSRESTIRKLLMSKEISWLISDNPSDLRLEIVGLQILNAQNLYTKDFSSFCTEIFNFEKTIFASC